MTNERLTTRDIATRGREPASDQNVPGAAEQDRAATAPGPANAPMFGDDELVGYRTRWNAIQTGFIDEPRRTVEEADALVAQLMSRLAEIFAGEREQLERQWDRGGDVSTEDLRQALQRYRSFFHRLLSM